MSQNKPDPTEFVNDHQKIPAGLIVLALTGVLAAAGAFVAYEPRTQEEFTETFYVGTPAGESFEITGTHACGNAFRLAALNAMINQTSPISPRSSNALSAVIADLTRIHDSDIKNRCLILAIHINKVIPGEK